MTDYEYYSAFQKLPNTNTNIIRLPENDRIQILFGFPKMNMDIIWIPKIVLSFMFESTF